MGKDVANDVECLALRCENGNDPRVIGLLASAMSSLGTDLVHCTNFNATFWGRAAAARLKLPAVTAEHSTNRASRRERLLVRLGNLLFGRSTNCVVACAQTQVPVLIDEGCDERRVSVIHNGVDPAQYCADSSRVATRETLGIADSQVLVLVVASLSPQKNHLLLIKAAARAVAMGQPIQLVFAGEGPMRARLESTIQDLQMGDYVSLLGVRSDIPQLLAASDVVALTSLPLIETFPMCLLEAMASGRPVVATRVGGIPELVLDGTTGILVDSEDEVSLSSALAELAADGPLRATMGLAARSRLEESFTLQSMTTAYETIFSGALHDTD